MRNGAACARNASIGRLHLTRCAGSSSSVLHGLKSLRENSANCTSAAKQYAEKWPIWRSSGRFRSVLLVQVVANIGSLDSLEGLEHSKLEMLVA